MPTRGQRGRIAADSKQEDFLEPGAKEGGLPPGLICLSRGQRRRTSWRASLLIQGTKKKDFLEDQFACPGTKKEDFFLEGQFAYPGDKEGGLPGGPICLSRGQRRRTSWPVCFLGTKKEDLPGTKKEDFLEGQFAYPGDKEGGLPGGPVCFSRGQRRRTSWRASLLIPGTKKEDFLEGQFTYPGNKEDLKIKVRRLKLRVWEPKMLKLRVWEFKN